VDHPERVALLRDGVQGGGVWADLGAGSGSFTHALRDLLPADAIIYAVDSDARAVAQLHALALQAGATVSPQQADFTAPLDLPPLDGLLLANALHFVRQQAPLLAQLVTLLRPGGTLLLVEYDLALPRPWVPFPIAATAFGQLARSAGLIAPRIVGTRRSPSNGSVMYAAQAYRPS
jgi:SAM-dependent methyltransferase